MLSAVFGVILMLVIICFLTVIFVVLPVWYIEKKITDKLFEKYQKMKYGNDSNNTSKPQTASTTGQINSCKFCSTVAVIPELYNNCDLNYCDVTEILQGAGNIGVQTLNEDISVCSMKYCPVCGRKLVKNDIELVNEKAQQKID